MLISGGGGHNAQMSRLMEQLNAEGHPYTYIAFTEKGATPIGVSACFEVPPVRDKHSRLRTIILIPHFFINYFKAVFLCLIRYNVKGVISTGPGICIIFSIICRMLGKPVVFIETWSRFKTKSLTGRIMYYVANVFYIQNSSLIRIYPKAIYSGLL